nr:MAG TPA: hypothetical protein [Caudoviricetes sp.]
MRDASGAFLFLFFPQPHVFMLYNIKKSFISKFPAFFFGGSIFSPYLARSFKISWYEKNNFNVGYRLDNYGR